MLASLLTVLLTASAGEGTSPPLLTAEGVARHHDGKPASDLPFVAVMIDAGLPDGIGASLVVMPVSFLRVHLGALTNGVGAGVRLGATVLAFPTWPVRPMLNVDAGYVFGGHAAWVLDSITDPRLKALVSGANVGFLDAHAGFEFGSRNVALVLSGGISWIDVDLGRQSLTLGNTAVTTGSTSLRGFIPSARLGFMFSFG